MIYLISLSTALFGFIIGYLVFKKPKTKSKQKCNHNFSSWYNSINSETFQEKKCVDCGFMKHKSKF